MARGSLMEKSGEPVLVYSPEELIAFAEADGMELSFEDAKIIVGAMGNESTVEDSPEFFGVLGPTPQPRLSAAQVAVLPKRLQSLLRGTGE